MKATKKLLICANIEESSLEKLCSFFEMEDLTSISEVHIVHCFETKIYAGEFFVTYLPTQEQYPEIESSVIKMLNTLSSKISNRAQDLPLKTRCLFNSSPKLAILEYCKEYEIDKMFIATRNLKGLEGLFSSSFAEYMVRHAPCELQIIRD